MLSFIFRNKFELNAFCCNERKRKICRTDLIESTQFLRFDKVMFSCMTGYKNRLSIDTKCQLVVNYLKPIKKALNDSNKVHIAVPINKNFHTCFNDYSQILNWLRNDLLTICDSSREYKFEISTIEWHSKSHTDRTSFIDSILQLAPIKLCANVEIRFDGDHLRPMKLPVKAISNWLHRKCEGIGEKRFPRLRIYSSNIRNAQELCDHLKTVITIRILIFVVIWIFRVSKKPLFLCDHIRLSSNFIEELVQAKAK